MQSFIFLVEPEKTQAQPPAKIERPSTASRRVPKDKSNVQVVDDSHKQVRDLSDITLFLEFWTFWYYSRRSK